jgi:SAM-dependent methyltransferase
MSAAASDLAGVAYWDEVWEAPTKTAFDSTNLYNRQLAALMRRFLEPVSKCGLILEAGCGDSIVTSFVADQGFRTAGIDYSEAGCDKFRRNAPGSMGYQADIFDPPAQLLGAADGVFSLGLVEHFTDTTATIAALARLVRPDGYVLTVVPNLRGTVGWLQKLLNRAAFDVHVPLAPSDLRAAHSDLEVIDADYMGGISYGVVNPGKSVLSRSVVGLLSRLSRIPLALKVPSVQAFAPYCYCLART